MLPVNVKQTLYKYQFYKMQKYFKNHINFQIAYNKYIHVFQSLFDILMQKVNIFYVSLKKGRQQLKRHDTGDREAGIQLLDSIL